MPADELRAERRASKTKRQNSKRQPRQGWLRRLVKWGVVLGIWGLIALVLVVAWYARDLPDVRNASQLQLRPSITVLASDGSVIARYGEQVGEALNIDELPPHLIKAVMAIEDRRFYWHPGLDPIGLLRAVWVNFRAGRTVQGGSTITQQLAKNLFLTPDRTLKRKIQEAILALWLERIASKDQIMTAYLNRVYLGAGTYGVEAAAQTYFGKSARDVDLKEAAILAGLLQAPSRFSPLSNPHLAEQRAEIVLAAMKDAGYLSNQDKAALDAVPPAPRRKPGSGESVRYYSDWVVDQLENFIGTVGQPITITTTLNRADQQSAEQRAQNMLVEAGKKANISEVALVQLAPDGAVQAMLGGARYGKSQFNRATQARRQPGSAFKAIIYLAGLEAGLRPESMVEDAPIEIGAWKPENFDGEYQGMVTLRDAFAFSLNTVAIRVLQQASPAAAIAAARRLGITANLGQELSLALGTSEVSLLELSGAFSSFANGGVAVWPYAITKITADDGTVLYQRSAPTPQQVIAPDILPQMISLLSAVVAYGTGQGAQLGDRQVIGKTGTSQDYRDAWFIGSTADFTLGIWMGNDNNQRMSRVTGGSFPARLWREVAADSSANRPARPIIGADAALLGVAMPTAPAVGANTVAPEEDAGITGLLQRLRSHGTPSAPVNSQQLNP